MKNKLLFWGALAISLTFGFSLTACGDVITEKPAGEVPHKIKNTTWTRQIDGNAVFLSFSDDCMTVSGFSNVAQNGTWKINGSESLRCCFQKDGSADVLDFEYTCTQDTLSIRCCSRSYLNGEWTNDLDANEDDQGEDDQDEEEIPPL